MKSKMVNVVGTEAPYGRECNYKYIELYIDTLVKTCKEPIKSSSKQLWIESCNQRLEVIDGKLLRDESEFILQAQGRPVHALLSRG